MKRPKAYLFLLGVVLGADALMEIVRAIGPWKFFQNLAAIAATVAVFLAVVQRERPNIRPSVRSAFQGTLTFDIALFALLAILTSASVAYDSVLPLLPAIFLGSAYPRLILAIGVWLWLLALLSLFSLGWMIELGYAYLVVGVAGFWVRDLTLRIIPKPSTPPVGGQVSASWLAEL